MDNKIDYEYSQELSERVAEQQEVSEGFDVKEFASKTKLRQYYELEEKRDLINEVKLQVEKGNYLSPNRRDIKNINKNNDISVAIENSFFENEIENKTDKERILSFLNEEEAKISAMDNVYQHSLRNANPFVRFIGMPAMNTIQDLFNPTDLGDVASFVRVSTLGVGVALEPAKIGAIVSLEAGSALFETGADFLSAKNLGSDFGIDEAKKSFAVNFTGGLFFAGIGQASKNLINKKLQQTVDNTIIKANNIDEVPNKINKELQQQEIINNNIKEANEIIEEVKKSGVELENPIIVESVETGFTPNQREVLNVVNEKSIADLDDDRLNNVIINEISNSSGGADNLVENMKVSNGIDLGKIQINTIDKYNFDLSDTDPNSLFSLENKIKTDLKVLNNLDYGKGFDIAAFDFVKRTKGLEFFNNKTQKEVLDFIAEPDSVISIKRMVLQKMDENLNKAELSIYNIFKQMEETTRANNINFEDLVAADSRITDTIFANIYRASDDAKQMATNKLLTDLINVSKNKIKSLSDIFNFIEIENNGSITHSILTGEIPNVKMLNGEIVENAKNVDIDKIKAFQFYREQFFKKKLLLDTNKFYNEEENIIQELIKNTTPEEFNLIMGKDFADPNNIRYFLRQDLFINKSKFDPKIDFSTVNLDGLDSLVSEITVDTPMKEIDNIFKGVKLKNKTQTIKKIKEIVKAEKKKTKVPNIIDRLLQNKQSHENRILNKVFNIYNKKDILDYLEVFTNKIDPLTGVKDVRGRNFRMTQDEAIKVAAERDLKSKTNQYSDKLKNFITSYNEATGKTQIELDRTYFGYDIPDKYGEVPSSSRSIDIRETDIMTLHKKMFGKDNIPTIETINQVMREVHQSQVVKIGEYLKKTHPEMSNTQIIEEYLTKWNIKDKVNVEYIELPKGVGGMVSYRTGQKPTLKLPIFTKDPIKELGIARHELQHLYEYFFKWGENLNDRIRNFTDFSNSPSLTEETLSKIKSGEVVTLREGLGEFYNNHFFNFKDDVFESSYNGLKLSEAYSNLDDYNKAALFLEALNKTTVSARYGKLDSTTVLKSSNNFDQQSKNFYEAFDLFLNTSDEYNIEDFITNKFNSPELMYRFLSDVTQSSNRRTYGAIQNGLINNIADDILGYSTRELAYDLKTGRASKNVQDKYNVQMNAQKYSAMTDMGKRMELGMFLTSTNTQEITTSNIVTSMLLKSLIGFRPMKDNVSLTALRVLNFAKNSEIEKSLNPIKYTKNILDSKTYKEPLKDIKQILNAKALSYVTVSADLLESTGRTIVFSENQLRKSVNKIMTDFLKLDRGIQSEKLMLSKASMRLNQLSDKLRKISPNNEYLMKTGEHREFQNLMNDYRIFENNLSENDFKAYIIKDTAASMRGVGADDILSKMLAHRSTQADLHEIFTKNSFDELSPKQKKMFNSTSYTKEEFDLFKMNETPKWIYSKGNIDEVATDDFDLRAMYYSGMNEDDTVGKGLILGKGVQSKKQNFNFLKSTIFSIAREVKEGQVDKYIDGIYVGKKSSMEIASTLAESLPALIAHPSAYLLGGYILKEMITDGQNLIDNIESDIDDLMSLEPKKWKDVYHTYVESSPFGPLIGTSETSTSAIATFNYLRNNYERGTMTTLFIKSLTGAYITSVEAIFRESGMSESKAKSSARKYIQTPSGQAFLYRSINNQMPLIGKQLKTNVQRSNSETSRYLYTNGFIDLNEHQNNLNNIWKK